VTVEDKYRGPYMIYFATLLIIAGFSIALIIMAIRINSWYPMIIGSALYFSYYIFFWVEMRKLLTRYYADKFREDMDRNYNYDSIKKTEVV
jgi:hypothetical protein